mmetsp:Transcript_1877/g.3295  ORF Transcript_1877/g.3295 Transcript_1877/m.3295 type:complete len:233 (-) Transcript_1877:49-747(-)
MLNRANALRSAARRIGQSRFVFAYTSPLMEKVTIKVPTMGDSITEGTIVEWTAAVGQAVKTDDVVALLETDKVTVDIKAEVDGVIVQHFGAVDDTVEVGANLYEIDTEGVATVQADAAESPTAADASSSSSPETAPTAAAAPATSVPPASARQPSISFLGKEGWANRLSGNEATPQSLPDTPNGTVVLDGSMIDSTYGRPVFSELEMEALVLGGANISPSVVSVSSGAKFSS